MQKDRKPYKILVIEDNPGDFFLVEDYLLEKMAVPQIIQAGNFAEAELILDSNEIFDVILLDLSLPDKSGEELILEIMKKASGIPVIVLTGFTDMSFSVKSLSLGVSDYLLKDDLNAQVLFKSIVYSKERTSFISELKLSEKRYRELFHLSPQPMFVCDKETQMFLDINDAAVRHYGYDEKEFKRLNLRKILYEKDDLNQGNLELKNESITKHLLKNGKIIDVDMRASELIFQNKPAYLILVTDITERKKYIDAIELQNKKLKEIAWIQSHVVRSPLAKLMGLIELYDVIGEDEDISAADYRKHILEAANELDDVIKDISEKTRAVNPD